MATPPHTSLPLVRSIDLIKREPLDYGGFGEVYLCYHATLGQVVSKIMYTGSLRNEEIKRSLLEEGTTMASLNHERVVKLLGVIMEDKDCSLVMELCPRGNLLVMLDTVTVPISMKGRIIIEILEAMMYLTDQGVVHKDIKPENILVDKDFHIKIADFGLATCQAWSKLTKKESRRKNVIGQSADVRGAGTLSYMAPEHLESIHTPSSEKSDVYSFAIVVWVILTGKEPYANARSEDQMSQCVRNGDRPAENLIPDDTPEEMIQLMKRCWNHNPLQRPTFKECYTFFLPFYTEKLEPHVERDVDDLRKICEGPEELIDVMTSLSVTRESFSADCPAPLVSSDRSVPVEATVEELSGIQNDPPVGSIQTDAKPASSPSVLERKLEQELQYHICGSYNCENQPDAANSYHNNNANPLLQNHVSISDHAVRQPEQEIPSCQSSVHSWTKAEPVQPISQEEAWCHPTAGLYDSMNSATAVPFLLPMSASTSCLNFNQQHPHSHYNRQQSWPVYPVSDTSTPDMSPGRLLNPTKSILPQDPGSLYIQNASGIQIGNNNTMSIGGYDRSLLSLDANNSANSSIKEGILKYEDHAVTEEHLDLLRDNIGMKWKRCARQLGLTTVEIETIEHDFQREGLPEMVHQMLERWKMKEGSIGCTIGKLCRALDGNIKVDVIQKILNTCGSSS
ncbi:receptor-interacting serine/threonine-protein kinase 1 isoform X1 [Micropterus dolomieu]|uniref:receptor-interacting serine/threonine-protein kinase 1 isoform X1 n=1 Tax=Micropterus dolomieu TaxID=147949 RepID=UPI001E8D1289|nr:receptor-interacting serine/threonine-protein kinase 1 isoform X1 [Micropterus dolomieu]XP_045908402.1 receptor-interacting serine/threonine-protein kinase 1 isoform X1 [Micropterus dolomieu]